MFYDEGLGLVRMAWTPDPLLPRLGAALLLALTIVSARKPGEEKLSLSESAGSSDCPLVLACDVTAVSPCVRQPQPVM